jgi:hypothetical protein
MLFKIDHTYFVKIANLRLFILFSRISTTISWTNIDQTMNASLKRINKIKKKILKKNVQSIFNFFVYSIID